MSTIIVVKEGSELVMGTDSRYMNAAKTRIVSDGSEKIKEIAPQTFLRNERELERFLFPKR